MTGVPPALSPARRLLDVTGAVTLAVLLSPVLLTAVAVVAWEGRPVLFRQPRVGHLGRTIEVWKLRTMREGRTTHLGRRLRDTSIDEIPQLWNVLRGDMRLVGPRPRVHKEIDMTDPLEQARFAVPPGLTGWSQIQGNRHLPEAERRRLDIEYATRGDLKMDLQILLQTPWVVLLNRK